MRFASEGAMILALRKFLFLLVVLVVKMWLVKALFLRILPLPVFLNLLAAPRFVFIFGKISGKNWYERRRKCALGCYPPENIWYS